MSSGTDHVLYCIDSPPLAERASAHRISGWCLASRGIERLAAAGGDGRRLALTAGLPRPDVARDHPAYPGAEASGFTVELPPEGLGDGGTIELLLNLAGRRGKRRRLALDLSSDGVQRLDYASHRLSRRFEPEQLEERLARSLERRPGLTFRLDIVNKCNLRCVMCHYSDEAIFRRPMRQVTVEEMHHLFEGIAPAVRSVVLSCADEPLVSKHFVPILAYFAEQHPHVDVELCTNAMLMNAEVRHEMVEKGVSHLILSLDGVQAETLEGIRVGARYERVLGNILALRDLKRAAGTAAPAFVLDFVMMRRNVHEAPAFVELAARLEAAMIDFRHVIPSPYFDDPDELLANHPARYNHYRQKILEASRRHRVDVVLPPPFPTAERFTPGEEPAVDLADFEAVVPDEALPEVPVPLKRPRDFRARHPRGTASRLFASTYCERPFSEILIADQELVKPCAWHRRPLGRLSDGATLEEIFHGPEFQRLRRNMLRPEGDPACQGCPVKAQYLLAETAQFTGRGAGRSRLKQWLRRAALALLP